MASGLIPPRHEAVSAKLTTTAPGRRRFNRVLAFREILPAEASNVTVAVGSAGTLAGGGEAPQPHPLSTERNPRTFFTTFAGSRGCWFSRRSSRRRQGCLRAAGWGAGAPRAGSRGCWCLSGKSSRRRRGRLRAAGWKVACRSFQHTPRFPGHLPSFLRKMAVSAPESSFSTVSPLRFLRAPVAWVPAVLYPPSLPAPNSSEKL
jgi:hypothetical protein